MWSKDKPQEQVWDIFQDIKDADAKTNQKNRFVISFDDIKGVNAKTNQ